MAIALLAACDITGGKHPDGTGGGGGGLGGGSGTGGGAVPAPAPRDLYLGQSRGVQRDSRGISHLLTVSPDAATFIYARCASACQAPGSWAGVTLHAGEYLQAATMAVAPSGQVYILWDSPTGLVNLVQCSASDCAQPGVWAPSRYVLGSTTGPERAALVGHRSAMVGEGGTLYVVLERAMTGSGSEAVLGACAPGCTSPTAWSFGRLLAKVCRTASIARGAAQLGVACLDGSGALTYLECRQGCESASGWAPLVTFTADVVAGAQLAFAGATPLLAFRDELYRLNLVGCETGCDTPSSWHGIAFSAGSHPGPQPESVALSATSTGAVALATVEAPSVWLRTCRADCLALSSPWTALKVDSDALAQATRRTEPPSTCAAGSTPFSETHVDGDLDILGAGEALAVSDTAHDATGCGTNTATYYEAGHRMRYIELPRP